MDMDKAIKGLLRKPQNIARGLGYRGHKIFTYVEIEKNDLLE